MNERFMACDEFGADRYYSEDGVTFYGAFADEVTTRDVLWHHGYQMWSWCDERKDWVA